MGQVIVSWAVKALPPFLPLPLPLSFPLSVPCFDECLLCVRHSEAWGNKRQVLVPALINADGGSWGASRGLWEENGDTSHRRLLALQERSNRTLLTCRDSRALLKGAWVHVCECMHVCVCTRILMGGQGHMVERGWMGGVPSIRNLGELWCVNSQLLPENNKPVKFPLCRPQSFLKVTWQFILGPGYCLVLLICPHMYPPNCNILVAGKSIREKEDYHQLPSLLLLLVSDQILFSPEHAPSWEGGGCCLDKTRSRPVMIVSPPTESRRDRLRLRALSAQAGCTCCCGLVLVSWVECGSSIVLTCPSASHPSPRLLSEPDKLSVGPPPSFTTTGTSSLLWTFYS